MRLVQYIEDKIAGWNLTPIWVHPAIFNSSFVRTAQTIAQYDRDYATKFVAHISSHQQFAVIMCARFLREAMALNYVEEIVNSNVPIESDECGIAFEAAHNHVISRLSKMLSIERMAEIHNNVAVFYEGYLFCCHQFVAITHLQNYKEKVLDEIELMQEIELFRCSKEDGKDERPNNPGDSGR